MTAISCPVCQAPFREVVREGILIDICTQCRGVWLDRGELEKLIGAMRQEPFDRTALNTEPMPLAYGRSNAAERTHTHDRPPARHPRGDAPAPYSAYADDDDHRRTPTKEYRKSKMERLFDIFD